MTPTTLNRLTHLTDRQAELHALLSHPDTIADRTQYRQLSQELAAAAPIVRAFTRHQTLLTQHTNTRQMLQDPDPAIRTLAREELPFLTAAITASETALHTLLTPQPSAPPKAILLEIRAGTGGHEAALFVGDLVKMYHAYAESCHWHTEILSRHHAERGGYKEIITRIQTPDAYPRLRYESGVHRVQRVPATESQGRIHTSACTVAVLPEHPDPATAPINPAHLRIDTYRASGAGGQHVNKTESAIRLTHLPTGLVVECQDQRSQHKNRARAMAILQARLHQQELDRRHQEQATTRKTQVGSGDRSQRIRTYNYPQNRLTDHRIPLTLHQLDTILTGNLTPLLTPLQSHHHPTISPA